MKNLPVLLIIALLIPSVAWAVENIDFGDWGESIWVESYAEYFDIVVKVNDQVVAALPTRNALIAGMGNEVIVLNRLFVFSEDFLSWAESCDEDVIGNITIERANPVLEAPLSIVLEDCIAIEYEALSTEDSPFQENYVGKCRLSFLQDCFASGHHQPD